MTERDQAKQQDPVDATAPTELPDGDEVETPMLAVWLSLGFILAAGLYGLYLGTSAKQQHKDQSDATSQLTAPGPVLSSTRGSSSAQDGHPA